MVKVIGLGLINFFVKRRKYGGQGLAEVWTKRSILSWEMAVPLFGINGYI